MITVLAASASSDDSIFSDILEVIGFGAVAGIGISIAFSLMIRGFLLSEVARRENRSGAAMGNLAIGVVFAIVCVLAVAGGLLSMLHR